MWRHPSGPSAGGPWAAMTAWRNGAARLKRLPWRAWGIGPSCWHKSPSPPPPTTAPAPCGRPSSSRTAPPRMTAFPYTLNRGAIAGVNGIGIHQMGSLPVSPQGLGIDTLDNRVRANRGAMAGVNSIGVGGIGTIAFSGGGGFGGLGNAGNGGRGGNAEAPTASSLGGEPKPRRAAEDSLVPSASPLL
jgi:hypothetical protein